MSFDVDRPIGVDNPVTGPLPERRCGRCQRAFPGDPTLFFQTDWALCPTCEAILLPGRPARTASGPSPGTIAPIATAVTPRP
jgi:hypothetical protein